MLLRQIGRQTVALSRALTTSSLVGSLQGRQVSPIKDGTRVASVFKPHLMHRMYSSKADNPTIDLNTLVSDESRLASVDVLNQKGNVPVINLGNLGRLSKTEDGRYALSNHTENPFRAALDNGQIRWKADVPVNATEVAQVVEFTIDVNRTLHVNTGTHGAPDGKTVAEDPEYAEANFSKQDLHTAWNLDNVSVHIVSQGAKPLYPKKIDVVDAWCFSSKSAYETPRGEIASTVAKVFSELFAMLTKNETSYNITQHGDGSTGVNKGTMTQTFNKKPD